MRRSRQTDPHSAVNMPTSISEEARDLSLFPWNTELPLWEIPMRIVFVVTMASLFLAFSSSPVAARDGEFDNECAWELVNDRHVGTDCSINMTGADGKTYCFSNDGALAAFMKDSRDNVRKAEDAFDRRFLANVPYRTEGAG